MKSKAVALGHPIHPMLIPFPIGFLAGAVLFDLGGRLRDDPSWWTAGGYLAIAGIIAALLAAIPGIVDYLYAVPPRSSGKERATKHAAVNSTAVVLFIVAVWIRGGADARPDPMVLILEVLGIAVLGFGGYLGGTLVTRNMISVDHRYAGAGKWKEQSIDATPGKATVVANDDELEVDQMKLLRIGDKRIVLARTGTGYVAFDDRCTHRGGSLAGGVMICGTVQCLWHGSQFDCTDGSVKAGPAREGIKTYRVSTDKTKVMLTI